MGTAQPDSRIVRLAVRPLRVWTTLCGPFVRALDRFADLMVEAGIEALYVHARKAWLKGLSPKENREIPPLDYGRVYRLAARLAVPVIINGVRSLERRELARKPPECP